MDRNILEVKRNSLALGKSKIQLQHKVRDLEKLGDRYKNEARKTLRLGREDLAKLALQNKQVAKATQQQLKKKVEALARQIAEFERVKEELASQIMIYKIKRDEIVSTRSAAEAQLSVEELKWGLSLENSFGNSKDAFMRLEQEIGEIQAQVEATRELGSMRLPSLELGNSDPLPGASGEVSIELEQLKQELEKPEP